MGWSREVLVSGWRRNRLVSYPTATLCKWSRFTRHARGCTSDSCMVSWLCLRRGWCIRGFPPFQLPLLICLKNKSLALHCGCRNMNPRSCRLFICFRHQCMAIHTSFLPLFSFARTSLLFFLYSSPTSLAHENAKTTKAKTILIASHGNSKKEKENSPPSLT